MARKHNLKSETKNYIDHLHLQLQMKVSRKRLPSDIGAQRKVQEQPSMQQDFPKVTLYLSSPCLALAFAPFVVRVIPRLPTLVEQLALQSWGTENFADAETHEICRSFQ